MSTQNLSKPLQIRLNQEFLTTLEQLCPFYGMTRGVLLRHKIREKLLEEMQDELREFKKKKKKRA